MIESKTANIKGMLCAARTDSYVGPDGKKVLSRKRKKWKSRPNRNRKRSGTKSYSVRYKHWCFCHLRQHRTSSFINSNGDKERPSMTRIETANPSDQQHAWYCKSNRDGGTAYECDCKPSVQKQYENILALSDEKIMALGLTCGFMLHSGYDGLNSNKLMPVTDAGTLLRFAHRLLEEVKCPTRL